MKSILLATPLLLAVCSCNSKSIVRPASLPDNVLSDKPIVLKEGQAIVFMKAGDQNLMIAASVLDGQLCVAEVDPKGHNFGITWRDSETWQTSTEISDGQNHKIVMDRDMDGYADFKAEFSPTETHRFELKGQEWMELKPSEK
jgi:hypothetical protein